MKDVVAQMRHFRGSGRPGFSLFLGAGASKSSGVPLAEELADLAFRELFESQGNIVKSTDPIDQVCERVRVWETLQPWYDGSKPRYQLAMENALLAPGVRAAFLKRHTEKARLSVGYRHLAQLLKARVFDTVYTTNFDALVRRGCEGVLEEPLVDVAAPEAFEIQSSSPCDPRLIRLHGDYWHGNVLNTEGELEQTPGLRFKTAYQLSRPQGMIVVGYGGLDKKLMTQLFQENIGDKNFLKNGLFWCVRRGSSAPPHVKVLTDKDTEGRIHIVEIDGFDDAMGLLTRGFELDADKWDLTESLRSSIEVQALLADAAQLVIDAEHMGPRIADRVEDVFSRLTERLHASAAVLVLENPNLGRVLSAVNMGAIKSFDSASSFFRDLPDELSCEVAAMDLCAEDQFASLFSNRRVRAYQVWRGGEQKATAAFGFGESGVRRDHDERIITAVCGLLVLAIKGISFVADWPSLSLDDQIARLAYSYYEKRGCCGGSPDADWLRAEEEVRRSITKGI